MEDCIAPAVLQLALTEGFDAKSMTETLKEKRKRKAESAASGQKNIEERLRSERSLR